MPETRVLIAGSAGMVGSAVQQRLQKEDRFEVLTADRVDVDMRHQAAVREFLQDVRADWMVIAAAKVGGIHANVTYPADFIYDNLMIEANLIKGAFDTGLKQVVFLGSSCIYPRNASQPIVESELLNGALEPSNDAYAVAKIAGIKLCEAFNRQHETDFRSLMPTNLYGRNDNFHSEDSHVVPALIRRMHEAKLRNSPEVLVWGSGKPLREFLYVDDLADAVAFVLAMSRQQYWSYVDPHLSHVNVGTGVEVSIRELAETIGDVVGFDGRLVFDEDKPDGMPRKLLDTEKLRTMGWTHSTALIEGLSQTYEWFLEAGNEARAGRSEPPRHLST